MTYRSHGDEALRESEARSRVRIADGDIEREILERSAVGGQFWEITPDLLGVLQPNGYFSHANPAWLTVLGWAETEVQAQSIFELLHPDDVEPTRSGFEHLKRGNPILRFENRYRRKDGDYKWFAWAAAPLGDAYFCSGRDITAEKAQAELIDQRNAELDRLWKNSRDLQVVIGPDGIFRSVNFAWSEILGHEPNAVIGQSFLDFIWPEDVNLTWTALDTASRINDLTNFENRYVHKNGTLRWISWHTSVEGELIYGYGRDITAEKAAQADLAQAQEALRQSQKMEAVGQLTGGIAHDFNNMIAIVIGHLDIARRRLSRGEADVERYLDFAREGADRAATLTQRLLAFSRQSPLAPEVLNFNLLVANISELLCRTLGEHISYETVLATDLWQVHVDPRQLENAILNLAVNARDAMPEGGKLTLETANVHLDERYAATDPGLIPGQYAMIAVTDVGIGMDAETMRRVFEPFFTTKPVGKGTGLGLSMVYGFAKQSGGHVGIYSEPGHGTSVKIYLPRHFGAMDEAGATVARAPDIPLSTSAAETILVVEDDDRVRQMSCELLRELGYTVHEAASGESAMRIFDSGVQIDLLFTDIVMAGMTGQQLADALRAKRPNLKVVYTTGYTRDAIVHNGVLDPGVAFLLKPFTVEDLAFKIRAVLDN